MWRDFLIFTVQIGGYDESDKYCIRIRRYNLLIKETQDSIRFIGDNYEKINMATRERKIDRGEL